MRKFTSALLFLILLSLTLLSLSFTARREIDLSIPYIHYYDYIENGLIIERADGTDSRIIQGVAPETANSIVWRGWSPSGRWFAMSSYHSNGEGADFWQQTYIVSTDGQQQIDLGGAELSGLQMQWANDDDFLLIMKTDYSEGAIQFQILDVEREEYLAQTTLRGLGFSEVTLAWSDDGQIAYVSSNRTIITLYRNGFSEITRIDNGQDWRIEPTLYQRRLLYPYRIRVDDYIIMRIVDLDSDEYIDIEDNVWGRAPHPYRVQWSPTGNHVLIYARPCNDEACDSWLKLVDWQTGEISSIEPIIPITNGNDGECSYYYTCSQLWSPNGQFAVLVDENDIIYLLDVQTQITQQIFSDETLTYFQWMPDGELLLFFQDDDYLYRYNPATEQSEVMDFSVDTQTHSLSPSPSSEFIGLPSSPPTVITRNGVIAIQTIAHGHSTHSNSYPMSYTWHEDEEWIMANYTISFAGGGGPIASVLFDMAGTVRRELPTSSGAGFVPNRVIPYLTDGQSESVKREPIFQLPHDGQLISVGWHPTDFNRLVTYSPAGGLTFWSLDNGQAEIIHKVNLTESLANELPVGSKIYWLPEQNIVVLGHSIYQAIDIETGDIIESDFEYPTLNISEDRAVIEFTASDTVVPLNITNIQLDLPQFLSSDRQTFVVDDSDYALGFYHIDTYTGDITYFDDLNHFYTADANGSLVATSSIYDCCITLFDTNEGEMVDQFYATAYSLTFSADGSRLATTAPGLVTIWDISDIGQSR